ncbi:VOC family protein [Chachezhania sediminis]|uniref:VOC family protein n=1 Tax=Chachezhania sediminis TaxID=2599291 RepID=UPI00131B638B|nr:VOC family protein [Chachezhania sediminis]
MAERTGPGGDAMSVFSHVHFQILPATDVARARDFYRDVLGFAVKRDAPYGDSRWVFMALPGAATMVHFDKVDELPFHHQPKLVLAASDVDVAIAGLEAKGVSLVAGPDDAPWEPGLRWAMFRDCEGNLILIQTVKEEYDG